MFFLEVALGQFMSEGGVGTWKIVPLMQGNKSLTGYTELLSSGYPLLLLHRKLFCSLIFAFSFTRCLLYVVSTHKSPKYHFLLLIFFIFCNNIFSPVGNQDIFLKGHSSRSVYCFHLMEITPMIKTIILAYVFTLFLFN